MIWKQFKNCIIFCLSICLKTLHVQCMNMDLGQFFMYKNKPYVYRNFLSIIIVTKYIRISMLSSLKSFVFFCFAIFLSYIFITIYICINEYENTLTYFFPLKSAHIQIEKSYWKCFSSFLGQKPPLIAAHIYYRVRAYL